MCFIRVYSRSFAAILFVSPVFAAINFEEQIVPILVKHCRACHNPQKAEGALRITTRVGSMKAIVPTAPEKSPLWLRMEIPAGKPGAMPPDGQLSQPQRDLVRDWIKEGANWPNGIVLEGMKLPSEERETVARFHAKILATTKEKTPAEMKPYKATIPGTSATFEMVPIPAGEFTMGTPDSEKNHRKDESPQHKVRIDAFWMAKFEVTWDEYRPFMFHRDEGVDAVSRPTRPYVEMSFGMGLEGFPAISMTQHAANKYAEWLSSKTGHFYRLPTEAEWEYACRAGASTAYSYGDDPAQLGDHAWFATNSNGKYQKVGTKKPNAWGLFDMSGNVMEWTLDQYSLDFYGKSPLDNPWNKATKAYPHAVRGGSWSDPPDMLRCGARVQSDPDWKMQDPQMPKSPWYETDAQWLGFRLVRPLKVPSAEEMYKYWNSGVERHVY